MFQNTAMVVLLEHKQGMHLGLEARSCGVNLNST